MKLGEALRFWPYLRALLRPVPGRTHRFAPACLFFLCTLAQAHNPSSSFVRLAVDRAAVELSLSLNWSELPFLSELDDNRDGRLEQAEVDRHRDRLHQRLSAALEISGPGGAARPAQLRRLELVEGTGHLEAEWRYLLPAQREGLRLRSRLAELLGPGHVSLVKITAGPEVREAVLHRGSPEVPFAAPGLAAQAAAFLWLGMRHIFTGYDHVLFLLGLLLAGGAALELVKIVTSFTVAHSLTLALATLAAVALPVRFVESAIALSICYVAAENVLFPAVAHRWVVTFLFGLVHGFGFSAVLRELELPRASLATSLVFFNLGVEVGQVALVLLVVPALALLARSAQRRTIIASVSTVIFAVGAFWFVQRTFFLTK